MLLFFSINKPKKQAQIKTKLESRKLSLTIFPIVLGQFLNREFCPSNFSTPIVLSDEPVVIGVFFADGKQGPYKREHQDPHTPKRTSLFLGMLKDGDRSPLPSGCLQQPPAMSSQSAFFWLHPLFIKQSLGMDQPAVGILEVCVKLLVLI